MEKSYLFNPFTIMNEGTDKLKLEYVRILDSIIDDEDNPFVIASNIERYANMYVIIGEMIARYKRVVDDLKQSIKAQEVTQVYKQRNTWISTNDGKPPAMSYFEAMAYDQVKDQYKELNGAAENLTRFKNAWESTETKINALKKKYEAKKYELKIDG